MGNLIDLLGKPIDEMTVEELEIRINLIKRMKVVEVKPSTTKTDTSNKAKRLKDLIKGLSAEQISALLKSGEQK